ncbi:ABC transporter ATP-binding protein [Aminicella lysinilytica]|uniref:ATP-binding cassette subfamily B protein n=1 Tax=Aminicella lysinilytica TaxID=433323 RepID=A0A4R6PYX4_9FIRM|nr:ABC transporter ATP-binding protein [Aminicella lysinilytica]TDP50364.1 ATP-binding cassette subfamily B protein [Aminicella lysinilytica]
MTKIFKNLKPYWKVVIVLVLLLMVQAYCDLALPQYTQDIIDVGIQNKGVEHILPEKTTAKEYKAASIFMSKSEKKSWENSYEKEGKYYVLKVTDQGKLDKLDDELMTPIVLTYQLGHSSVSNFKKTVKNAIKDNPNPAISVYASEIDDMTVDEIGNIINYDVKTFKAEDENGDTHTYVDMRPMMQKMISSGAMDSKTISSAKTQMNKTIESVGSETLKSMGIAYASGCDKKAGIDVDAMQKSYLWAEGRKMFGMAAIMLAVAMVVSFLASKVGASIGRDLRGNLFRNVMSFSNAEMDKFSTASLITRSTNDVQQIQIVTTMLLRMVLYAPVMGIWGVIKVMNTGANMGWVIALGVLVIIGLVMLLMSVALPKFKIMQKLVDALNLVSREILTGLPVIRAFGREKTEEERFDVANTNLKKTQLFTNRVMTFMQPSMMIVMNGLVVLITWVAAHRIDTGTMQVGAMTAFITYSMMIVMSFMIITVMSIMLPRAGVAAERIDEVIKTRSSILEAEEPARIRSPKGVVEFDHVNFRYPGAEDDVLSDIDFTAEPGKTTAIIGSTGSGKSTLVNLIPRFYDITGGTIKVDGEDVRGLALDDLRGEIGFVPQKGVLFSGTIASNIKFGADDATDEDIRSAAEIAQATEFIEEKDEKYESYISQGGSNVSGGQKQRMAIARAIAKKPKILVFDDSFSALDMKTDARLRQELTEKVSQVTKIIVAQRISTILHADQILVLDEGRIVGKGTHSELMKSCDVYQEIAGSQLSQTELEGIE